MPLWKVKTIIFRVPNSSDNDDIKLDTEPFIRSTTETTLTEK